MVVAHPGAGGANAILESGMRAFIAAHGAQAVLISGMRTFIAAHGTLAIFVFVMRASPAAHGANAVFKGAILGVSGALVANVAGEEMGAVIIRTVGKVVVPAFKAADRAID